MTAVFASPVVLRGHALRRDGSIRDSVMYSLLASEWPPVRARLLARLQPRAGDNNHAD